MITRSLRLAALTTLALGATATAALADPGVTASITPNTPSTAGTATITLNGPFPAGLPSALEIQVQKGFTSSVKSVATLCSPSNGAAGTCPAASAIGSGKLNATIGPLGAVTIPLTLSLGAPSQSGDISTVYLYGSYDGVSFPAAARVFSSGGGLEILISKFPQLPAAFASFTPTIQSLSFTAGAKRTVTTKKVVKKKVHGKVKKSTKQVKTTYGFITTPSTCTGSWTGTATATFGTTPTALPFSAPCSK